MIAMVVAMAGKNVIGSHDEIPWYLPADLQHFRRLTTGHTVVMGRTTFESILARNSRPLPDRRNLVLTRNPNYSYDGVEVLHDTSDITRQDGDVYIIGGAQVYEATMSLADTLYVTEVHADIPGDTRFPDIDPGLWREKNREPHTKDAKNPYDYDFVVYVRR